MTKQESLISVTQRCRKRLDMSLPCHIDDVIRLLDEVEKILQEKSEQLPPWHGLGTGD